MGTNRKKENLSIPVMIFCIVGVVLTVFGFMLMRNGNFKLNVFSTDGSVTNLSTAKSADGTLVSTTVTLSYTASNSNYTATINDYDIDIQLGDTITLYYDFLDPSSVSLERTGYVGYISFIIGIILCIKTLPRFIRIIRDNYI